MQQFGEIRNVSRKCHCFAYARMSYFISQPIDFITMAEDHKLNIRMLL
jgi:hypothetical protein